MFVGAKMLIARIVRIPTGWMLLAILVPITLAVAASLRRAEEQ
jgi:hypothetical protein